LSADTHFVIIYDPAAGRGGGAGFCPHVVWAARMDAGEAACESLETRIAWRDDEEIPPRPGNEAGRVENAPRQSGDPGLLAGTDDVSRAWVQHPGATRPCHATMSDSK
jgi:hypothetical protein